MDFSQNNFAQQNLPPQMLNPALQYNDSPTSVGKVIRFGPNIYAFICDYCMSKHQNIGSLLHHTELHFQRNETSIVTPATMPPVCPTQNSQPQNTASMPVGTSSNSHGPAASPYPVQLQHSTQINQQEEYTDEVYEIIDLGYDFEGVKYPDAGNIDRIDSQATKKPRPRRTPSKSKVQRQKPKANRPNLNTLIASTNENTSQKCPFCVRSFSNASAMKRHLNTTHEKIFKKIIPQKKAYKCKICNTKFPKSDYTLESAYEHLKIHYSK